jgi:hypothetical protein
MRKLIVLMLVVVLGVITASCGQASEGANSAGSVFPSMSVLAPSPLEARAPGSGGGNGNGKGGNGNNQSGASTASSLQYAMVNDRNGDGLPNWGDSITFIVSTTATSEPNVELLCSQDGVAVYGAVWPLTLNPTLSSAAWQGGAAECTAKLYPLGDRKSILATISFTAGA